MGRALMERISEAVGRDRVARYGPDAGDDLSAEQVGILRSKPLVLDEDMRAALAQIGDHYGHAMIRLIEERDAAVGLRQERLDEMAGQADRWFEFADAMRDKRTIKHDGKPIPVTPEAPPASKKATPDASAQVTPTGSSEVPRGTEG